MTLGIKLAIEVTGDPWGTSYPENCIFDELTCTARLKNWREAKTAAFRLLEAPERQRRTTRHRGGSDADDAPVAKRKKKTNGPAADGNAEATVAEEDPVVDPTVANAARDFIAAVRKVKALVCSVSTFKLANNPP